MRSARTFTHYTVFAMQVIAVGDFNIAAEPRDVHSAITWDTLYAQSELDALHQLTSTLTDTWRQLHPEQEGVYTVWDEKTSARAFNVVRGGQVTFATVWYRTCRSGVMIQTAVGMHLTHCTRCRLM
jgi:exonuclease III